MHPDMEVFILTTIYFSAKIRLIIFSMYLLNKLFHNGLDFRPCFCMVTFGEFVDLSFCTSSVHFIYLFILISALDTKDPDLSMDIGVV